LSVVGMLREPLPVLSLNQLTHELDVVGTGTVCESRAVTNSDEFDTQANSASITSSVASWLLLGKPNPIGSAEINRANS